MRSGKSPTRKNIATMLVDPDGQGLNDHWAKTSQVLLTGAILHCCYVQRQEAATRPRSPTWMNCWHIPRWTFGRCWNGCSNLRIWATSPPLVARAVRTLLNLSEKELSSVVSTALSFLSLYRDPVVAGNTGRSDLQIRDLMYQVDPVSLYLVVRTADADRLRLLMLLTTHNRLRGGIWWVGTAHYACDSG